MKNKKFSLLGVTLGLCILSSIPAFASGWQKDTVGWWYGTNDTNTTWHANCWQWIDGNNDGIAECYYFDQNGYMLASTTTPDGFTVNADGAWTVNGIVQIQHVDWIRTYTAEMIQGEYRLAAHDIDGVTTIETDDTKYKFTIIDGNHLCKTVGNFTEIMNHKVLNEWDSFDIMGVYTIVTDDTIMATTNSGDESWVYKKVK